MCRERETEDKLHVPCEPGNDPVEIEKEIRKWVASYAKEHGWILNPDTRVLDIVLRGLARNCKKFGRPYCPCRLRSGDLEKDKDIVCPCIFHKDEVAGEGHCHCNLFFR
ncbi:MAG: Ferredoxin thioredoxin reductase catalytic beta chain [Methanoregulaceae archaeon PtaU1.Bin222]|nr:MAG: Ferredoxin thioredoxin reductase catalytic beta chain [Methanoregulaceae archaeon PtaU1.Bin222]